MRGEELSEGTGRRDEGRGGEVRVGEGKGGKGRLEEET